MEKVKRKKRVGCSAVYEDDSITAAGILIDQVFNNYVVTDCVFDILPISDILSCSLVSKTWNSVSREFLRRKRICLLTCHSHDLEGHDNRLQLFKYDILGNNPFKGVHVIVENKIGYSGVQADVQKIFTLLTPKYVTISFEDTGAFWGEQYPFLSFLRDWQSSNACEHLRIVGRVLIPWRMTEIIPRTSFTGFPNLKSFQSNYIPPDWRVVNDDHLAVMNRCPDLTDFKTPVHAQALGLFNENNKLAIIRWIHLSNKEEIDEKVLERLEELAVPVEILSLKDYNWTPKQIKCITRLSNTLRKVVLVDFSSPDERLVTVQIPPMTTISQVLVQHERSRLPYSSHVKDNEAILNIFPNAEITHHFKHSDGDFPSSSGNNTDSSKEDGYLI